MIDRDAKRRSSLKPRHVTFRLRLGTVGIAAGLLLAGVPGAGAGAGPQQPEFAGFAPDEQSDPIDLFSGDFRYSVSLLDVPGPSGKFPLTLAYQSGVTADQESGWVGLGWTLNPGSIVRQVRGLPDDFRGEGNCSTLDDGDCVATTEDIQPNSTFGLGLDGNLELLGADTGVGLGISAGFKGYYNSYRGLGYARSIGLSGQASASGINASVGLNLSLDSQQGLQAATSLSLANVLSVNAGLGAVNGLSTLSVGASYRDYLKVNADALSFLGYARPTSIPGAGREMTGWNIRVNFKGGGEIQGVYPNLQASGFYTIEHVKNPNQRLNPAVGYLNVEKALAAGVGSKLLLDFNREKDGPIYDNSPNLAMPILTHDLFVMSGPGIAATFRAYRNDIPVLFDPEQKSDLMGGAIGVDVGGGVIAKFGLSGSLNGTSTRIGGWDGGQGGALLDAASKVAPSSPASGWERTFFKVIGETVPAAPSAILPGEAAPVRVPIKAAASFDLNDLPPGFFAAEPNLTSDGANRFGISLNQDKRAPRATLVEAFTNEQLDKQRPAFPEFAPSRKGSQLYSERGAQHIGGFRVTSRGGTRYVYALPVYNTKHEEHEFSVARSDFQPNTDCTIVLPPIEGTDSYKYKIAGTEQYHHIKKVSPYVVTYLLTAVLGPDYVDSDSVPGPSDGDFGYWVRLDYGKKDAAFEWRRPYYGANFIRGHDNGAYAVGVQRRNDKGFFTFGEREQWYLSAVQTKTHIARFHLEDRSDGHAAKSTKLSNQALDVGRASQRLSRIDLYVKDQTRPEKKWEAIRRVHFNYDYSLVPGAPGATSASTGRLTLTKVWTTYGSNTRGELSPHLFDYQAGDPASNPPFSFSASDRWGTQRATGSLLTNAQCEQAGGSNDPTLTSLAKYTSQESSTKDRDAAAWSLRRIVEPTGREIRVEYEADDYGFVQDRPAMTMRPIVAVANPTAVASNLGTIDPRSHQSGSAVADARRVHFAVPSGTTASDIEREYVRAGERIYFKIRVALRDGVNDPAHGKWETVSGYANVAATGVTALTGGQVLGYVELERVSDFHPFSVAAWQYLRLSQPELISDSAINGDPGATNPFVEAAKVVTMADFLGEIITLARGVYQTWFDAKWGQQLDLAHSWVRLRAPKGIKIGGGARVRSVRYRDQWNASTGGLEPEGETGFVYEYRLPGGGSSGVAAYEPSEGADENAVRDAKPFTGKVLLASDYKLFAETPSPEGYFPAPGVGYSRVTVRTLASETARQRAIQGTVPARTSTGGPTIHEFYTAKDFPVRTAETSVDKRRNPEPAVIPLPFLGMITLKSLVASQGYAVVLNDMHGKPRRTTQYEYGRAWNAASQDFAVRSLPVSSTAFEYSATGGEGGGPFTVVSKLASLEADAKRTTTDPDYAREAEMFAETRQNRTESFEVGLNLNVDVTYIIVPVPIVVPVPSFSYSLSEAKTVVVTKVVHQAGVLKRLVTTKGPAKSVTTHELFDPASGRPLLSTDTNDFGDPIYDYRLPARWSYPRMGPAFLSTALKLDLFGAQRVGTRDLRLAQPSIAACSEQAQSLTQPCLPIGSRLSLGKDGGARSLLLVSADSTGLLLRADSTLPTELPSYAELVHSGNRNLLDTDAGAIRALSDPTSGRIAFPCRWTTTEDCGVCYEKSQITVVKCTAEAWASGFGRLRHSVHAVSNDCLRGKGDLGADLSVEQGPGGLQWVRSVARGGRPCRVIVLDETGRAVDLRSIDSTARLRVSAPPHEAAPSVAAQKMPYTGLALDATVEGRAVSLYLYSDCDGWTGTREVTIPSVNHCDRRHERTRYKLRNVLSASATVFGDNWPTVADDVRFRGDPLQLVLQSAFYSSRDPFSQGVMGIFRPWRDYAYQEARRQSAVVDRRHDGAFDLTLFDWTDYESRACASQWRWKSQVTRYATGGAPSEEVNPTGAYSTTLFGLSGTVPVAVAANARFQEVAFESFEGFKANQKVEPIESGEGHFRFWTLGTRPESVPSNCPPDLLVTGAIQAQTIRLDMNDLPLVVSSALLPVLDANSGAATLEGLSVGLPGESCLHPVTSVAKAPNGKLVLVFEPANGDCGPSGPISPESGRIHGAQVRLHMDCKKGNPMAAVRGIHIQDGKAHTGRRGLRVEQLVDFPQPGLSLQPGKSYVLSAWISRDDIDVPTFSSVTGLGVQVKFWKDGVEVVGSRPGLFRPDGPVIAGWQRVEQTFVMPPAAQSITMGLQNGTGRGAARAYFDDVRVMPTDSHLETFVYDPISLRIRARLDAHNFATLYEYDPDGSLAQTQRETPQGFLTSAEARSHARERP